MQSDNITEKAKRLGLDTGSSTNHADNLRTIAMQVGLDDFNPETDLQELNGLLDERLNEQESNIESLEEPVETLDTPIEDAERQPRFGENEYNQAKDKNGKYDKNYYANRKNELDNKVKEAEKEKHRGDKLNKKYKEGEDDPSKKYKNKNIFDKARDNANLAKAKTDRFQNKVNEAKKMYQMAAHPGEALKDKVKEAAKEKTKDTAKNVGKKTAEATKNAGKKAAQAGKVIGKKAVSGVKAFISLLKTRPELMIIVVGVGAIIFIILIIALLLADEFGDDSMQDATGLYGYDYVEPKCSEIKITNGEHAGLYTLEEYIAGVVQSEVGGFLTETRREAAKAGAVAARSFVLTHVDSSCSISNSTNSQTFKTPSDEARKVAEETKGLVLVNSSGDITSTQYDAFCTEIPQTDPDFYIICQKEQKISKEWVDNQGKNISAAWKNGTKTQAHGNGMSQWGAAYLAEVEEYTFKDILSFYYDEFSLRSVYKSFILSNNWIQEISAKPTSTVQTQILNKPIKDVLSESEYNNLNNMIYDAVIQAGKGTREALIAAAVTPIKYLAENYSYVLPYALTGGHYSNINSSTTNLNINKTTTTYYGIDPDWGSPISITYNGNYYNKYGPDCSSWVPWVYKNAGIDLSVLTAKQYVNYGIKHDMGGSYVAQPGDLLANDGHVTMVVGVDEENDKYYIAHASGGNYGTIITPVSFNYTDYYIVEMSEYITEHQNENYEDEYKNGVLAY